MEGIKATCDNVLYGALKAWQPVDGPRVTVDTILLASFAQARRRDNLIELGSATGVISLLLALRLPQSVRIEGLEIQKELVDLAKRNALENELEERVHFSLGDLREVKKMYAPQSFDVVVTNPPYDEPARSRWTKSFSDATARQGLYCSLLDLVRASRFLLKNRGHLYMIFRAQRAAELLWSLTQNNILPKRIRLVHPRPDKKASMILVDAVRSAGTGVTIEPPLFIYDEQGHFTPDLLAAYRLPEGRA
ncbi:MAG TPA: methyltransferase [Aminobacterium sp.]|uniref:tRNA1(Val) (adenine(37)-N6)-methyltransferase n=1 Tax=Aminobacterium TaxID=81466 RepID=UPI000ECBB4F9|nr:methyltransferase domain-containing protein [Aminobacterium sp. UBA4834]HCA41239.1 methyltransferase [Aminobacterium sp.]